jgi:hypothetical protein
VQRRCAAIIASLDIPRPFDLGQFLARLAARRNRAIFLHPFTSGPGIPCGVWLGTARADHVFCEQGTSPWHQTHITLHEVAHMLLGHGGEQRDGRRLAALLAPDVGPGLVRVVMERSAYTTTEEQGAETLASLILGRASGNPPRRPAMEAESAAVMRRLELAWGCRC